MMPSLCLDDPKRHHPPIAPTPAPQYRADTARRPFSVDVLRGPPCPPSAPSISPRGVFDPRPLPASVPKAVPASGAQRAQSPGMVLAPGHSRPGPAAPPTSPPAVGRPVTLGSPVRCDKNDCGVCSPRQRSLSPRQPPPSTPPPIPTVQATPVVPEKDKLMQGYIFLGKLQSYVQQSIQDAVRPLLLQLDAANAEVVNVRRACGKLEETVDHSSARVQKLEALVGNYKEKLEQMDGTLIERTITLDKYGTEIEQGNAKRKQLAESLTEKVERLEKSVEVLDNVVPALEEWQNNHGDEHPTMELTESLAEKVERLASNVEALENVVPKLEEWQKIHGSENTSMFKSIERRLRDVPTLDTLYNKQDIDQQLRKKLDKQKFEDLKTHLKSTLTEFDRIIKQALSLKANNTEMQKECERIWKAMYELIQKVENKIIRKQALMGRAIENKADKADIYAKDVIDIKLKDKLDVPFGDQVPYEVSFIPEETFAVDMLPERLVAMPIPDTIPSKATHVQLSIQFHLTDHVSMCQFAMSTFRNFGPMDENTQSCRVSWFTDAMREILWTFRVNGRYGRTIFAKWTDSRPAWQMIRQWVSHYSCRAMIKVVAWEVYEEESMPITSLPSAIKKTTDKGEHCSAKRKGETAMLVEPPERLEWGDALPEDEDLDTDIDRTEKVNWLGDEGIKSGRPTVEKKESVFVIG